MTHTKLSMIIAASLFTASAAFADDVVVKQVWLYDTTLDAAADTLPADMSRKYVDLDGDGYTDAVLTAREGVDLHTALDAIADSDTAELRARTGSDIKDAAVDAGIATRGAAAVATTDRVGERVGPTWENRSLHAQTRGIAEGDTYSARDEMNREPIPVVDRTTTGGADRQGPQITGITQRMADLDGDGIADVFITLRRDLDMHATLNAIANADTSETRTMTGSDIKDTAYKAGVATRSAAAVASTDRVGERLNPTLENRTLHAQTRGVAPEPGETEVDVVVTGAAAETLRTAEVDRRAAQADAGDAADPERLVIINEGHPNNAFAPPAGTGGFSDGYIARQAQDRFAELDVDNSGQLTRTEVPDGTLLRFDYVAYDLDSDGEISRNEFQSWFAATGQLGDTPATAGEDTLGEND